MIENVSNKIIDLITNGVRPEDIAIISPVNNTILDYKIKNILNEIKKNTYFFKVLGSYPEF